jgi:hypothetical protein
MPKVNLEEGLSWFVDLWSPKIIADLNDYKVQLVKAHDEWVWHNLRPTDYESAPGRGSHLRKWLKALVRLFNRLL